MKLAGAVLALIPLAFGGMEKVWEVRVGDYIKEPPGWSEDKTHAISGLAFSLDGMRLAVAIDPKHRANAVVATDRTHILILNLASPKEQIRQFDVETCPTPLAWSPSGQAVLLCGTIVKIADGKSCDTLPPDLRRIRSALSWGVSLWIDSTRVLRLSEILDADCVRSGTWTPIGNADFPPGERGIADVAAEKGWVLLWHTVGVRPNEFTEYAVADSKSGEWIGGSNSRHTHVDRGILAPGASAWCGWDGRNSHCWNVRDGKEVGTVDGIKGYQITNAATKSPRAIAEHWVRPGAFCYLCGAKLDRRAVWDFSTRTVVSSWRPNAQEWDSIHREGEPDRCALSPDGQFVAEGGDGVVRLYRLTP